MTVDKTTEVLWFSLLKNASKGHDSNKLLNKFKI